MRSLLFIFILLSNTLFCQDSKPLDFNLTVKTTKGTPDVGRDVVFVETTTYERIAFKTDNEGKLHTVFDHGNKWLGSVGEMRNCIKLETRFGGNAQRTLTYNPESYERENEILPDRRSVQFTEVDQQRFDPMSVPTRTESIVQIVMVDQKGKLYAKVPVYLTCFATKTRYYGVSNSVGGVSFKVPINQKYEIDVDGVESLKWIDLGPQPMVTTLRVLYQPRTFKESKSSKFTLQTLPQNVEPSSSHARVKLNVRKNGQKAINEDVYVRMLKSNTVYKAKTNDLGEVIFMLPIRNNYFIDFEYQRGAAEINLSQVQGIAYQAFSVEYIVDPKLSNIENFIPSVKELVDYDLQNFVDKMYPEPNSGDIDFQLSWGNKFNQNSKEALLEIGIKVKSKMDRKSTDPLNICFVVDKSGSMMGEDRIDQLKKSLIQFVSQLDEKDRVSIVVFDELATLAVPSGLVGDKKKIIDVIHAIEASGGTSIYNGMILGFEEVKKFAKPNQINRMILLTDGYGSKPPAEVIEKAKSYIKQGIELSTVGVGVDYNQALLSQLASAGGGMLHLAGTSANIQDAFQHELESILYPMAKKAVLTVKYNDQIVYRQLYGYSNEKLTPGQMNVEIPHLFPGLNQLALLKFDLINATKELEKEQVTVVLEYIDAITEKPVVLTKNIHPEWMLAGGELDMTIDKEHKKLLAVAIANQSLKMMANAFESGNKKEAQAAVQSGYDQMKALFPNAKPEKIIAVMDRLLEYVEAFETLEAHTQHE